VNARTCGPCTNTRATNSPRGCSRRRPSSTASPAPEPREEPDGPDPLATLEPHDEDGQEEHGTPDDSADDAGQAASGGTAGHNGHGVLPPGTAPATGARDETERAAWLRAIPPPRLVRTDIIWDEED
jgi:hypothetical protein